MCGIAGFQTNLNGSVRTILAMNNAVSHRGPDDGGFVLIDTTNRVTHDFASTASPGSIRSKLPILENVQELKFDAALSQTRYSIVDLSSAGHQPMWDLESSICITFNGEIYNHLELREEIQSHGLRFVSNSDTEVIIQGYKLWNVGVLNRLNGFFAIALYDRSLNRILLARDRLGKADLYYHQKADHAIYWASEIKAILCSTDIQRTAVDPIAVSDLILNGRRDRHGTFWSDIRDFPPGSYAWVRTNKNLSFERFWFPDLKRLKSSDLNIQEAASGLVERLEKSLAIRLRADVPIGFELSGGLDSSALVGIAAGILAKNISTYTVKFEESHSNEEPFAKMVADRYPNQIDYKVLIPPKSDFWASSDDFVDVQDEPFHSPNLQTNQSIRRLFKSRGVGVVITGAAGDELLAGYASQYFAPYLLHLVRNAKAYRFAKELLCNTEISAVSGLKSLLRLSLLNETKWIKKSMEQSGELACLSSIIPPQFLCFPETPLPQVTQDHFSNVTYGNMTSQLMNYWLRSSSKANYAIPIEVRSPFLDYNVVEYCLTLPPEFLIHNGWHKFVLRKAIQHLIPHDVVWRKNKMGFPFPYREWLISSKKTVTFLSNTTSCPLIQGPHLLEHYDLMARKFPVTLWRLISVLLWWKRVVQQERITISG